MAFTGSESTTRRRHRWASTCSSPAATTVAPGQVVERLKQRKVIASVTPRSYGVNYARLSPSLLTSPADVEAALRAVREIV